MNDSEQIKDALDSLALALTDHNHTWSQELAGKYETAIKIIEDAERLSVAQSVTSEPKITLS